MSYKLEIAFNTIAELQEFISNTVEPVSPATAVAIDTPKATRAGRVSKGLKPDLNAAPIAEISEPVRADPIPETKEPALTYDYVAQATTDAVAACNGSAPVKKLLEEFGAKTAKELPKEQWAAYVRKCGDLIKSKKEEQELA